MTGFRRGLDRRAFLGMAAAATAVPLVGCSPAPVPDDRGGRIRVVVLGAGLAGLAAAYELMKAGHDVVVLEAQDRPGGRVLTVREGFSGGGHAEMGAVRIFDSHAYTQRYVAEFGLELVAYDQGLRAYALQGRRFLAPADGRPWPISGLHPREQPDPAARYGDYLGAEDVGDPAAPDWPTGVPALRELDETTLDGYLRRRGASRAWREWFYAASGRIGRFNAAVLFALESLPGGGGPASIQGGNDRLPYAFAAALGSRITFGAEVVRIAPDDSGVTIGFRDRQGRQEVRADRCVCALPFGPLRRVRLDGRFSSPKRRAIERLTYMPAARCYVQTRTRFWESDPLGRLGGLELVATDTSAGRIWNTTSQQPGDGLGMLHAYLIDSDAVTFAAHGDQRVDTLRRQLADLVPGLGAQVVAVADKVWQEDRWAGGGWALVPPGDLRWMWPAIRRAEQRVHFAGEHTSLWVAWMNGALESADRVVAEIARAER